MIEPFERWALDFIGSINPSSNQKSYILVATEYVTKWVEAVALPRAIEEQMRLGYLTSKGLVGISHDLEEHY